MGCASGTMKCVLNIINIINALLGILLVVLASFIVHSAPQVYVIYLFIVGGIILLTSFLGCCGICKENVCMTTTYACILLGVLVLQIIGKFYPIDDSAIRKIAADDVQKTWMQEIEHPGAMNNTQQTYHCCGKDRPEDYYSIQRPSFPASCYPDNIVNKTALYNTGCVTAAGDNFVTFFNYAANSTWGTLAWTAAVVVFAFYLVHRFRQRQQRYNY